VALFEHEVVIRVVMDTSGVTAGAAKTAAQVKALENTLNASAKKAGVQWERVGLGMQNLGRTMTQFVTLPVAAGFAVATVAGYRYEKALLKVKNLTGLTAAQTALYGEQIKKLAPAVGVGPQALAESFYFIASSGFKAKAAMELLTISAKATAAGMGDAQTTADVLTSAINAYGHENLTAARAADILMKTIQVGKAEPIALARSLGRIMPVAAQLGVSLSQVGGAIAGLTLTGLSSAEAVTALRGTMIALVAPAKMSIDELKRVGTSYQEITGIIRDKGLLPALEFLRQKTDGNMLSMRKIIPNVRALNGVLSLLGENYKKNVIVTQKVTDSQGKLNEAFAFTKTTAVFKMDQAIASIKTSFTDLGQTILPTVASILTKIAGLAKAFGNMPSWVKNVALIGLAFVAIVGPITMAAGSIIRSIALIKAAMAGASALQLIGGPGKIIAPKLPVAAPGMLPGAGTGIIGGSGVPTAAAGAAAGSAFMGAFAIGAIAAIPLIAVGITAALTKNMSSKETLGGVERSMKEGGGMAASRSAAANAAYVQQRAKLIAESQKPIIQKLEMRYSVVGWEQAQKVRDAINTIKALADKGIELNLKNLGKQGPAALAALRATLMNELNITARQANAILNTIAGKKLDFKFPKQMGDALKKTKDEVQSIGGAIVKGLAKTGKDGGSGLAKGMNAGQGPTRAAAKGLTTAAAVVGIAGKLIAQGEAGGKGLGKGLGKGVGPTRKAARDLTAAAANVTVPDGYSLGSSVGSGLAQGMLDQVGPTRAAAAALGAAATLPIKNWVQPGSPSKVTMKLGLSLAEGLVAGMNKGKTAVIEAASSLASSVVSVLDAALGAGVAINDLGASNLPTAKYAAKWAKKAANMMKAIIKAMQAAFAGIDIGKATKGDNGKTAGWKADAFGSVVSMAEAVGSIFTTFAELTTEKIDAAVVSIRAVKAKAKTIAKAIAGLVRSILAVFNKTVVSEFAASGATRILDLASAIAGVITTFAVVTGKQIDDAVTGLAYVAGDGSATSPVGRLAAAVKSLAEAIKTAFTKTTYSDAMLTATNAAFELANSLAGILTTFSTMTDKTVNDAITGLNYLAKFEIIAPLALAIRTLADAVAFVFRDSLANLVVDEAAKAAMDLANNIAGVIVTFSTITKGTVDLAMVGIANVVASAPLLGEKLKEMVNALKTPLLAVAADPAFTPTGEVATKVAAFVSDIASVIGSLAGLYSKSTDSEGVETITDYVDLAITGAKNVAARATELGTELKAMVRALSNALLEGLDMVQLANLTPVLGKLSEIATAIKDIVLALAEMTAEKLTGAQDSGAALGAGFLAGLRSQYDLIIAEAKRIVTDTNTILAGGSVGATVLASAAAGAGTGKSTTMVNVTFSGDINAVTPAVAQKSGENIAAAVIKTLADAKRSTLRGSA